MSKQQRAQYNKRKKTADKAVDKCNETVYGIDNILIRNANSVLKSTNYNFIPAREQLINNYHGLMTMLMKLFVNTIKLAATEQSYL